MIYTIAKKGHVFDGCYLIGYLRDEGAGRTTIMLAYGHTIDVLDSETEDVPGMLDALKAELTQMVQQRAQQGVTQAVAIQTYMRVMGKADNLMDDTEGEAV